MSPGTTRDRQLEKAAQKIREARQEVADIPKGDKGLSDHLLLLLLGLFEEGLSDHGGDE